MALHTPEMKTFVRNTEKGKKVSSSPLEEKKMVYEIIMGKKEAMSWKDSKEEWREERKRVNDVIIL